MTTTTLTPKLSKLIARLGSDSEGEVIATVSALKRVLEANNLSFHDLADNLTGGKYEEPKYEKPEPAGYREMIHFCLEHDDCISNWERDFLLGMQRWRGEPSQKQIIKIRTIYADLQEGL